jgi:ribosomal protein S18 acetylase RimI-like enzyme
MGREYGSHMFSAPLYSSGGGGVYFEQRYGALLLSHLLSGAPLFELDDLAAVTSVRFQARDASPVDDFLITGIRSDSTAVTAVVAARHNPKLQKSSKDSRKLLVALLSALKDRETVEIEGTWRVVVVCSVTSVHAMQLAEIAAIARNSLDSADFRQQVASPTRTNRTIRDRLAQLDLLVEDAAEEVGVTHWQDPTWLLLSLMYVRLLHLEERDMSDRTSAIRMLAPLTNVGDLSAGEALFQRLQEIVGTVAPAGGHVDERTLRSLLGTEVSDDLWVDGIGRRVSRDPDVVRHLRTYRTHLMNMRQGARRSLGLSNDQVRRSFSFEPELPSELVSLLRGQFIVLVGPVGAGKSDVAMRWLLENRADDLEGWGSPLCVFLRADEIVTSIASAIKERIGVADAPTRFGVDLVIDGLDERQGASPLGSIGEFLSLYPKCRVVVTSRDGESFPTGTNISVVREWSSDEARDLIARINEVDSWKVGSNWTPALCEAVRRPFFALLAAVHADGNQSRAELVELAVDAAARGRPLAPALARLAVETVRFGRGVDPHAVLGLSMGELTASRLVRYDGKRVQFSLPLFEQWFAAQGVLSGVVSPSEFCASEVDFARWRYVLAIAFSTGTHESVWPWMEHLVRWNPGAAGWVVGEGRRSGLGTIGEQPKVDVDVLAQRIWNAREAWAEALGVMSPVVNPRGFMGHVDPGSIDGLQLHVDDIGSGRVVVTWRVKPNSASPNVISGDALNRSNLRPPYVFFERSILDQESWSWSHTFETMGSKGLVEVLTSGLILHRLCPRDGIVDREWQSWLATRVLGIHEFSPRKLSSEEAIDRLGRLLRNPPGDVERKVQIDQLSVPIEWVQSLLDRVSSAGVDAIGDLWPSPDIEGAIGSRAYSPDRALARANAVFAAAGDAYEELRITLFPKFGRILEHAASFPAVLEGFFASGRDDPLGSDFGFSSVEYWFRPVRNEDPGRPLRAALRWDEVGRPSRWDNDEARDVFITRRQIDPLGSAFESTSVMSSIVDSSFWGRRPATHLAVDWLLSDLKKLAWIKSGDSPALVRLK